jgi:cytohesin|tara:strand:+ start:2183 stop:3847 length:1665 start_codon:yes stop_codon:yes gene_type:complete
MDFLKILGICVLVLGLSQCRKKSNPVEKEVHEAGYEMTAEGWFKAIEGNDVSVMRKMVDGDFDHKTKDIDGKSGLHVVAAAGSKEAGEYLLNKGHTIDIAGSEGRTPLMEAVFADRPEMVKWLLRQGADPNAKDNGGFMALMLASMEGKSAAVEELAPYHRADLDSALLLAALVGQAEVIDVLTNYGASVYARMEDGRTPLMLSAQNGHKQAAALLIDIGASRFSTTEAGDTAQSLAVAAGHSEIAAMIDSGFSGDSLAFETDEEVAEAMEEYLEDFDPGLEEPAEVGSLALNEDGGQDFAPLDRSGDSGDAPRDFTPESSDDLSENASNRTSADGALLGAAVGVISGEVGSNQTSPSERTSTRPRVPKTLAGARIGKVKFAPAGGGIDAPVSGAEIPLVMRHFRQRELPVEVREVSGGVASLRIAGAEPKEVQVQAGENIPQSNLVVVKVFSRTEQGKLNNNAPIEVGVVEVEDKSSGQRREWIAGRPASGHDPVALVEDAATGQRYVAKPGQRFTSEDGREFIVNDVRPSQLVIEDTSSGEVRTLRLRGPKG